MDSKVLVDILKSGTDYPWSISLEIEQTYLPMLDVSQNQTICILALRSYQD